MDKRIITYVVNLKRDVERHVYMEKLLAPYNFLSVEFVDAIYGNDLTKEELLEVFDVDLSYKRYGRALNRGEIGCTLSHYKCYRRLLMSSSDYALILEDDITILNNIDIIKDVVSIFNSNEPLVLFLSGDYWYKKCTEVISDKKILSVYDAVGTYAYFINKAGARLILEKNIKAACAADDWSMYRRQGLKMKAFYPYLIDANIESFESTIKQTYFGENRKNMPWKFILKAYWNALVKKILLKRGKFVSKIRK